jgi:hypothetical protein
MQYLILFPLLIHTPVIRGMNLEAYPPLAGVQAQVILNLHYGDTLTWWVDRCAAIHALEALCIVPLHGAPDSWMHPDGGLRAEYIPAWATWATNASRAIDADYIIPWNEPDISTCDYLEFFGCWGATRAAAYGRLVRAVAAECPGCKIVTGFMLHKDSEPFLAQLGIMPVYAAGFHDYAGYWDGMTEIPRHDLDRKVALMQRYLPGARLWLTEFNLITATDAPPLDLVVFERLQTDYVKWVFSEAPHYSIEVVMGYTYYTGWRNASLKEQIDLFK